MSKTPKADEVLVKIEYVGICGSDMHFFEAGRLGNWIVDCDLVGSATTRFVVKGSRSLSTHSTEA